MDLKVFKVMVDGGVQNNAKLQSLLKDVYRWCKPRTILVTSLPLNSSTGEHLKFRVSN